MAAGATIHTFDVQLADVDRGVYQELTLRVARHPSETDAYMLTRLLAYCLEYDEGIGFTEGVAATDEPAVLVRDLTGRITAWIEVGAPDATRLHYGSKLADRTVVYTYRDPAKVIANWAGKTIHAADAIALHSFDAGFLDDAADAEVAERALRSEITRHRITIAIKEGADPATAVAEALARDPAFIERTDRLTAQPQEPSSLEDRLRRWG